MATWLNGPISGILFYYCAPLPLNLYQMVFWLTSARSWNPYPKVRIPDYSQHDMSGHRNHILNNSSPELLVQLLHPKEMQLVSCILQKPYMLQTPIPYLVYIRHLVVVQLTSHIGQKERCSTHTILQKKRPQIRCNRTPIVKTPKNKTKL